LALLGCQTDIDTNLGLCVFRGGVTLSQAHIPELLAGNLFVTAAYHDFSGEVHYAGRIVLVPEPHSIVLLSLSVLAFGISIARKHASALAVHQKFDRPDAGTSA
jgi:hypothetical protein